MSDLLHEVDEVMRQERMEKFWAANKNYIVGFIIGTILLTAVISGYKSWNTGVQEKQTAQIITLQNADNYPENILKTEKLTLRPALRGVVLLQAGGAFLDKDNNEDALKLYKRAANDKSLPNELNHLGRLMSVRLLIDKDDQDGASLLETLKPVIADTKSPWTSHARLEASVISANKLSDLETALKHLKTVEDTAGLPESLYKRAKALNHIYSLKQKTSENTGS